MALKRKEESVRSEKILLVEDEDSLAIGLQYNLEEEGYLVKCVKDGRAAVQAFEGEDFDLIILDLMLPFLDGFEVAKRIRRESLQVPILIITARSGLEDKKRGFDIGVDDYLVKPFHLDELLLRVKRMLQRKRWYRPAGHLTHFRFGDNEVDFETLVARGKRGTFKLTSQEARLLSYLIENRGRVLSRSEILKEVWNMDSEMETRTVDNFMVRLRKYFEEDPKKPRFFRSIRGSGYIFES